MRHAHFELNTSTEGAECGLVRLIGGVWGQCAGQCGGEVRSVVDAASRILKEKAAQYPEIPRASFRWPRARQRFVVFRCSISPCSSGKSSD